MRKGVATGVWLGAALGIAVLAPSESNADDLGIVQPSSNGEEPATVEHTNGDAPTEIEAADAVAATPGESESAGSRPMIRFVNANPRVRYGGLIERRMGTQGSYRERIRHHGVYSSQHAQPDLSGEIRHNGAGTGRLARYHKRGRIRYDGVTRARDRSRIAAIRENWMGADRPVPRFGVAAH
jgi:hypothetical protein